MDWRRVGPHLTGLVLQLVGVLGQLPGAADYIGQRRNHTSMARCKAATKQAVLQPNPKRARTPAPPNIPAPTRPVCLLGHFRFGQLDLMMQESSHLAVEISP